MPVQPESFMAAAICASIESTRELHIQRTSSLRAFNSRQNSRTVRAAARRLDQRVGAIEDGEEVVLLG